METVKRMHLCLKETDKKLLDDLTHELKESNAGVIRRAIESYHEKVIPNKKEYEK